MEIMHRWRPKFANRDQVLQHSCCQLAAKSPSVHQVCMWHTHKLDWSQVDSYLLRQTAKMTYVCAVQSLFDPAMIHWSALNSLSKRSVTPPGWHEPLLWAASKKKLISRTPSFAPSKSVFIVIASLQESIGRLFDLSSPCWCTLFGVFGQTFCKISQLLLPLLGYFGSLSCVALIVCCAEPNFSAGLLRSVLEWERILAFIKWSLLDAAQRGILKHHSYSSSVYPGSDFEP